tara:strand:- start:5639 stop:6337 length:699 start_codon:yes stop_codon:yes gene_type:complete
MKFLAIIPARKNSKSVKNKNFINFCSKPLIYWTIDAAMKSKNLNQIIVSTDSAEIRNYAKKFNISTPHLRPRKLSTDKASTLDVLNYEVEKIEKQNKFFDYIVTLQPTSPLRNEVHIDKAIKMILRDKNADSLVSCLNVPHNYLPESLMTYNGKYIKSLSNHKKASRRQEKKNFLARNGAAIYITKRSKISRYIFGGKIIPYFMSLIESIDIDCEDDLRMAYVFKKYLIKNK